MGSSSTDTFPPLQVILEFRAGKMVMEGKRVVPDARKGLVRIGRGEEGLVHFQWIDRSTNTIEDDQIIFPDEAVYEKVNQASGRVYILKFNTDDRKFSIGCRSLMLRVTHKEFGEDDLDASIPQLQSEDMEEDDIYSRDGNLIGSNLGGDVTTGDVSSSSGPVKFKDLQRILSNIEPVGSTEDPDAGLGLEDILKPDLIMPLIETLPLEERLATYLPEEQCTPRDILEIMQSPPFRQQVDSFTYVLRTGQIDLSQFGVDPSKYRFTVLSFLEALEDSVLKASESDNMDLRHHSSSNDPMDESR